MQVWPTIERFVAEHGARGAGDGRRDAGLEPARGRRAHGRARRTAAFTGTIGGGTLEWGALAEAQALLADATARRTSTLDKALGPELGQCCGGRVLLTLERFGAADREAGRAACSGGTRGRGHDRWHSAATARLARVPRLRTRTRVRAIARCRMVA